MVIYFSSTACLLLLLIGIAAFLCAVIYTADLCRCMKTNCGQKEPNAGHARAIKTLKTLLSTIWKMAKNSVPVELAKVFRSEKGDQPTKNDELLPTLIREVLKALVSNLVSLLFNHFINKG